MHPLSVLRQEDFVRCWNGVLILEREPSAASTKVPTEKDQSSRPRSSSSSGQRQGGASRPLPLSLSSTSFLHFSAWSSWLSPKFSFRGCSLAHGVCPAGCSSVSVSPLPPVCLTSDISWSHIDFLYVWSGACTSSSTATASWLGTTLPHPSTEESILLVHLLLKRNRDTPDGQDPDKKSSTWGKGEGRNRDRNQPPPTTQHGRLSDLTYQR